MSETENVEFVPTPPAVIRVFVEHMIVDLEERVATPEAELAPDQLDIPDLFNQLAGWMKVAKDQGVTDAEFAAWITPETRYRP